MSGRNLKRILMLGAALFVLAVAGGCSDFLLGVVQSFGTVNGPKISTIAGNGTGGSLGDGGLATAAELHQPYDVAADSHGNLYLADCNNNSIRMVSASGILTTVVPSTSGLFNPQDVAVDGTTLYIADTGNQVVESVSTSGVGLVTVAGTGYTSFTTVTTSPVPATSVDLDYPSGLAVDSSHNLYITDNFNSRILKLASGNLTLFAGSATGAPGYSGDGGPAASAHLNFPNAIAFDAQGNMYIADGLNFAIRKVDIGGTITTIAGNGVNGTSGDGGPATAAEIGQPYGIAVDSSGNVYFSQLNSVVRMVDANGIITTVAGNIHLGSGYGGDGNVATAAMLDEPWGLAIDSSGNLLIADRINNRIRKVGTGR